MMCTSGLVLKTLILNTHFGVSTGIHNIVILNHFAVESAY